MQIFKAEVTWRCISSSEHYVSVLCENEGGALSANQNAVLQCKINSANQGVVELKINLTKNTLDPSYYNFV